MGQGNAWIAKGINDSSIYGCVLDMVLEYQYAYANNMYAYNHITVIFRIMRFALF
jgi:hypothetical protein